MKSKSNDMGRFSKVSCLMKIAVKFEIGQESGKIFENRVIKIEKDFAR